VPTPTTSWQSATSALAEGWRRTECGRRIAVAVTAATAMGKRIFQRSGNPLLLRERLTKQKVSIALRLTFR
jgi:hypothetical protein